MNTPDLRERIAEVLADLDEWCCDECRAAAIPDVYLPSADAVLEALGLELVGWSGHVRPDGSFGRVHDKNSVHMDGCIPLYRLGGSHE